MRGLQAIGATLVGVMILAIGAVLGMAHESRRAADIPVPSVADIGFAQDMSEHHDQAILMARTMSADVAPDVRGLADRIVTAQTAETATMRGWLTWFGAPATAAEPMSWMVGHGTDGHDGHASGDPASDAPASGDPASGGHPMPGMADTQQLRRLAELRGVEAEILFLQLMIRHHEGGVQMATAAHNDPRTHAATRQLALSMIGEQGDEIGLMRMLLLARGAEPLAG